MKINYIIGTWSGIRCNPKMNPAYYENVLKEHMKVFRSTKNSIDHVTIVRPFSFDHKTYYDFDLRENESFYDVENRYQSYGQWFKAAKKNLEDYDYFIFIEDDYVPGCDHFDRKLIDLYEEDSYLGSSVTPYGEFPEHLAISNGIISQASLRKVFSEDFRNFFDDFAEENPKYVWYYTNYQLVFSLYLLHRGITLKDYRNDYLVDFHKKGSIIDYSLPGAKNKEHIFTAIQTKY